MRRLLLLTALVAAPASAKLTQRELDTAVARPPVDARLPATAFTDQRGRRVTLAQVAGGRPLVLLFADFTCNHVCGPGLALTAGALHDAHLGPGRDYSFAVLGIDPKDPASAGQAMVDAQMASVPEVRRAVAVLTGTPSAVAAATGALGYRYLYDPAADQYAHDASLYVFHPDGRLATLLPELATTPATIAAAVRAPAAERPSFLSQVATLCYGLGAAHGTYGRPVVIGLQVLSALLIAAVGVGLWRRRRA